MTIHGAKGLEAPIVILPDMLASRGKSEPVLPAADGSVHYWLPPSDLARRPLLTRRVRRRPRFAPKKVTGYYMLR